MATQNVEAFYSSLSGHDTRTNTTFKVAELGDIGRFKTAVGTTGYIVETAKYVLAGAACTAKVPVVMKEVAVTTAALAGTAIMVTDITEIVAGVPRYALDSGLYGWIVVHSDYFEDLVVASAAYTAGDDITISATDATCKKYAPTLAADMADSTATETQAALDETKAVFAQAIESATTTSLNVRLFCR